MHPPTQVYPWAQWPFALLYFTGSGHFNRSMRLYVRVARREWLNRTADFHALTAAGCVQVREEEGLDFVRPRALPRALARPGRHQGTCGRVLSGVCQWRWSCVVVSVCQWRWSCVQALEVLAFECLYTPDGLVCGGDRTCEEPARTFSALSESFQVSRLSLSRVYR